MVALDIDTINPLVARVFRIESITLGDPKQNYIARYQGHLYNDDSAAAYDQLADALRPHDITPLFRSEKGQQMVLLMRGVVRPRPSNVWVNVILFALTVLSVLLAGTLFAYNGPVSNDNGQMILNILTHLGQGASFTISLLAILLCHEFGHYLMARYHKTAATLPYFIPFPLSPFGTMGAVIVQKEPHKNKRILLDIGMAGPLAGFIVAIPLLFIGLYLSKVDVINIPPGSTLQFEGNSLLYLLSKYLVFHQWLPTPASFGGVPPLLYWLRYFFTGTPTPFGGQDVMLHPIAWAAWIGLLVTALNLIPAGQLDGGHIVNGLFGKKRAILLLPVILGGLVLLGLVWVGWWLWAFLIFFLGRVYAEPLDQITPLDTKRKVLAVACLVIFILVFTPVPLRQLFGM
jgi:membrane-associated protease RseP (regulator of RpoE activity)